MKWLMIFNLPLAFFTSMFFLSGVRKSNIDYAEGENISIKEDSVTNRRPSYFFGAYYRTRGPSGGGIGVGK
ncbi:MAG: hypothetical protein KDK38_05020 [Leptospiraceae bacterium]|nr:hypothetical protein [Leptospiraceae bacterium]